MKRIIILVLTASVLTSAVHACDVCGCSSSNQFLGVLPQYHKNFIGLQYLYNSFEGNHPSLFENKPDEHSEDYYRTVQLWGRYNVGKRIQLFGFVPYRFNRQITDGIESRKEGLGDVSVLVNYLLLKDKATGEWQHQLLAGGGLKLPTGAYTGITAQDKLGIPNMQPGTGSWDFIANANYTVRHEKLGFNADASYTMTTVNSDKYKYGNRLNAGLLGFYTLQHKEVTFLPQVGFRYEYALHDYDDYARKWLNEQSGGYLAFATAGVQSYYKQWGLRITCQLPVAQHYSNGYVTAGYKLDAGLLFLF